jgi:small-conductance mechanosensitive channel
MKAKGLIITALRWILRISIFLLFLQLAFSIVDLPTEPVAVLLSYLPEALIAIVVLIIAWWLSSRLGNAFERLALERDMPFADLFTMAVKFIVIYVGIIIALDEIGLEVQALYILLAFMAGAFCVGFAGVFILRFKDVGADLASSMQLKRNGEIGDAIIFGERIGKIAEITNLSTTIETDEGRMIVPNTRLRDAIIIKDQNKSG